MIAVAHSFTSDTEPRYQTGIPITKSGAAVVISWISTDLGRFPSPQYVVYAPKYRKRGLYLSIHAF